MGHQITEYMADLLVRMEAECSNQRPRVDLF